MQYALVSFASNVLWAERVDRVVVITGMVGNGVESCDDVGRLGSIVAGEDGERLDLDGVFGSPVEEIQTAPDEARRGVAMSW